MKGLTNYTNKSLRANKVRTIVTVLGIALAAALLTAVFTTFTSLAHFLYLQEDAISGSWMAEVSSVEKAAISEGVEKAKQDSNITGIAELADVGFAELTSNEQNVLGHYQVVKSASGDVENLLSIKPSSGRMPEREGEVLLFDVWRTSEDVQIGDEITFLIGDRVVEVSEDAAEQTDASSTSFKDGEKLDSSTGYLYSSGYGSTDDDASPVNERLEGLHDRTYKVVGFYNRANYALSTATGTVALTVDDPEATGYTEVYLTLANASTSAQITTDVQSLFPDMHVNLHNALLRYIGVSNDTSIWSTFFGIIAVLAVVIIVSCISLIFNAFDISVGERIRQFGLLSSIGATRGQLRHAVLLEACIVGIGGIVLGIVIGILGCFVTFAFMGSIIASLAGRSDIPFEVCIDWKFIALAAALTLITVIVSAWIPALRASRTSIMDSIRTVGATRLSKKGIARANRATNVTSLWKKHGVAGRIFGIGGTLAHVNNKRSKASGRAAAVSMALSVILLMTAGSFGYFLGDLTHAVTGGAKAGDIGVTSQIIYDDERGSDRTSAGEIDTSLGSTQKVRDERLVSEEELYSKAYDELSVSAGAIPKGWVLSGTSEVSIPKTMAGEAYVEGYASDMQEEDDAYRALAYICYVDDDVFNEYAESCGLDARAFYQEGTVRAIGASESYGNDGETYKLLQMLAGTGEVDVVDELGDAVNKFDVTYIAKDYPSVAGSYGERAAFFLPMSSAKSTCLIESILLFRAYFDAEDGDHAALAKEIETRGNDYFHEIDKDDQSRARSFTSYNDYKEEMNANEMLAMVVNVFCALFAGILALIAMANVFNTVTNSLILRRREFAVMKSVGLSNKQFRRMVTDECMRFGIAGLVPGLIISGGISYLLWRMVVQSFQLPFTLPWNYVLAAILMTIVAMGLSVVYGLHRCNADNVVEALRTE